MRIIKTFDNFLKMRNVFPKNFHKLYLKCFTPATERLSCCVRLKTSQDSFLFSRSPSLSCNFVNKYSNGFRYVHTSQEETSPSNKNDVKKNNSVIYYGALTGQVKGIKIFTCCSSVGGIVLQPIIIQNMLNGSNLPVGVALCSCVAFFTFVTPFLIHMLTKKYVTEIRYNLGDDSYTLTTLSFFLQRIDTTFKVEDIKVPSSLPLFTTMVIKNRPVFIVSDSFLEIDHYIKMKGYDKPMDLKLSADEIEAAKNKES